MLSRSTFGSQSVLTYYWLGVKAELKSPLTITEISKVIGASLLTKRDIRELLNVPEPLTQNQNVNCAILSKLTPCNYHLAPLFS